MAFETTDRSPSFFLRFDSRASLRHCKRDSHRHEEAPTRLARRKEAFFASGSCSSRLHQDIRLGESYVSSIFFRLELFDLTLDPSLLYFPFQAAGLYLSLIRYGLISSAFPIWPEGSRAFSFIVQFQDASSSRKFVRDVDSKKFDLRALSDLCVLGIQGESDYRRFLEMLREGSVVGCSKGPTNRSAVFFQVGSLSRASHLVDKYKSYLPFGAGSKILVRYGELGRESQVSFHLRNFSRSGRGGSSSLADSLSFLILLLQFGVDVLDLDVLPLRPQQPWQDYKDELPRAAKRGQSGRPRVPEPNPPTPLSQQLQDPAPAHPRRIQISSPPRGGQRDTTRRARDIELPSIPSGPSSTLRRTRSASPPSRWTSSQPQKDLVDDAQTQRASSSTKAAVEDVSTAGVEKERRVAVEQKVAGRPSRQSYTCVGVGDLDDSDDEGDEVAAVEVPVSVWSSFG